MSCDKLTITTKKTTVERKSLYIEFLMYDHDIITLLLIHHCRIKLFTILTNKPIVINPKILFGRKQQEMTDDDKGMGNGKRKGE